MRNMVSCPNCDAEDVRGARFCPHCGVALGGNGVAPATHAPLVGLLREVAELQHALLDEQQKSRRIQARQFERALQAQAESLRETLSHHSAASDRLQAWQRWTAGLGAAVLVLIVVAVQVAG